jgi:hypothetical protein
VGNGVMSTGTKKTPLQGKRSFPFLFMSFLPCCQRERNGKRCSSSLDTFNDHCSTMSFNDFIANEES